MAGLRFLACPADKAHVPKRQGKKRGVTEKG